MDAYLRQVVDYLLNQSWQIAILAIAVALVTFFLRNKSAHVRYLLWLIVLVKCLAPPLYSIPLRLLPQNGFTGWLAGSEASDVDDEVIQATAASAYGPNLAEASTTAEEIDTSDKWTAAAIRSWLGIMWLAGMCSYLILNILRAMSTRRWLRRERKPLHVELRTRITAFFSTCGFKRLPKIWVVEDVNQPFVWGLLRGQIYLPADLLRVDNLEKQKNVLGHELSHVVRFDAGISLLQVIAQSVFWFNPFVWWANMWIRREREKCCDEMTVAGLSAHPKDYSRAIVEALGLDCRRSRRVPWLAIVGRANNLEQRVRAILRPGRTFRRHPSFIMAFAVLLIGAVTIPSCFVLSGRTDGRTKEADDGKAEFATEVVAASKDLPARKIVTADCVEKKMVPRADLPTGRPLSKPAAVGRVVRTAIAKGTILTEASFIPQGSFEELLAKLPKGMRAFTVNMRSGFPDLSLLHAGSIVDIWSHTKPSLEETIASPLMSEILVLAVQDDRTEEKDRTASRYGRLGVHITFQLDKQQAAALLSAMSKGSISIVAPRTTSDKTR